MTLSESPRCLLLSDFTIGGLVPFLEAADERPALRCAVGPAGPVQRVLLDESDACWRAQPEVAVVWTRPQAVAPAFGRLLEFEPVEPAQILAEVDQFAALLRRAAARVAALFVPSWTRPAPDRGLGLLDLSVRVGPAYHLLRMNARLVEAVADVANLHVLDAGRWLALAGPQACSPKLWHLGKIAFGPEVCRLAAADLKAGLRGLAGAARKLVVLDLDDTLWGGVVGELGWEHLALGGHHPAGEAFRAFQRALQALTRRGIILGIVSKNTEAVALEALDRHPEMVLRRADFAGWRINWADKVENLQALAAELQIGLDAVVFLDDHPAERARVRAALPEVLVPEWPADPRLYEQALRALACFDTPTLSAEDRTRARTYAAGRQRRDLLQTAQSVADYLQALELHVRCAALGPEDLPRAAQLLNKTNQMNLATRRLTETQLADWARHPAHRAYVFRVSDRFDDYGLTGLATLALSGAEAHLADFVLSCRVLGRGVEQTMLHAVAAQARALGGQQLVATYRPSPRNAPCRSFFEERSGLQPRRRAEDLEFVWDLRRPYPAPEHVTFYPAGA